MPQEIRSSFLTSLGSPSDVSAKRGVISEIRTKAFKEVFLRSRFDSRSYNLVNKRQILEKNHTPVTPHFLLIIPIGSNLSYDLFGCSVTEVENSQDRLAACLTANSHENPILLTDVIEEVNNYWKKLNPSCVSEDGVLDVNSSAFNFGQIFFPSSSAARIFSHALGAIKRNLSFYGLDSYKSRDMVDALFSIVEFGVLFSPYFIHCPAISDVLSNMFIFDEIHIEDGRVVENDRHSVSFLNRVLLDKQRLAPRSLRDEYFISSWVSEEVEKIELAPLKPCHRNVLERNHDDRGESTRANIYRRLDEIKQGSLQLIDYLSGLETTDIARLSIYRYEKSMIRREVSRLSRGTSVDDYTETLSRKLVESYIDNHKSYLTAIEPLYLEIGQIEGEVICGEFSCSPIGGRISFSGDSRLRPKDRMSLLSFNRDVLANEVEISEIGFGYVDVTVKNSNDLPLSDGDLCYLVPPVSTWGDISYMLRQSLSKEEMSERRSNLSISGEFFNQKENLLAYQVMTKMKTQDVVLVNSPPGGGKTSLLIDVATRLSKEGISVIIATSTVSQGLDVAQRFSNLDIKVTFLIRSSNAASSSYPYIPLVDFQPRIEEVDPGQIVIGTVAKLQLLKKAKADVLVVDEAYQSTYGDISLIKDVGSKLVMIGDPGQLEPVVTIDPTFMVIHGSKNHLSAPYGFSIGDSSIVPISSTYRMPQSTVEVIQPMFYPNLKFKSEQIRYKTFANDSPTAIQPLWNQISNDKSIIFDTGFFSQEKDPNIETERMVACISEMLLGTFMYEKDDQKQERMIAQIEAKDIAVITTGRKTISLIKSLLAKNSLSDVEVETVERWQGKEKLISFVFVMPDHLNNGPSASSIKRQSVMLSRHKIAVFVFGASPYGWDFPQLDVEPEATEHGR